VVYNTDRAQAEKTANLAKIANLETQIAEETDGQKLNILKLQKLSLEKRNETLDAIPETFDTSAWCADLTEDLAGEVGLIEVPGESQYFNIQPGYDGNAVYDSARDGQLTPTLAMTPAAAFYNLAMLPGWQKWKPTYRYGTITAIDGDLADVAMGEAESSQQALEINQASGLLNVPIEYMTCNGSAFEVYDEVLVKFNGQEWDDPVIIGFKNNPIGCIHNVILSLIDETRHTYFNYEEIYDLWNEDKSDFMFNFNSTKNRAILVDILRVLFEEVHPVIPPGEDLPPDIEYNFVSRFPSLTEMKNCFKLEGEIPPKPGVVKIVIDNSGSMRLRHVEEVVNDFMDWLKDIYGSDFDVTYTVERDERFLKWFVDNQG
jgi:hypothetical protein